MKKQIFQAVAALIAVCSMQAVRAEVVTLEMHWKGFSTPAQADGYLTIDVPVYADRGFTVGTTDIRNFHLTISGAVKGNGTFEKSVMNYWWGDNDGVVSFYSPYKLDFTKELVGQKMQNGYGFGVSYNDFLPWSESIPQTGFFVLNGPLGAFGPYLQTPTFYSDETYEFLVLTSLRAVGYIPPAPVPEPETYAMLLAGLGLLGAAARRRKQP